MTTAQWLARAREHGEVLTDLVRTWHPLRRPDYIGDVTISAQAAEQGCAIVRREVVAKGEGDPVKRFVLALASGDVSAVSTLLSEAWFGVPESRDCWGIRGFSEAVDLLDDPPED